MKKEQIQFVKYGICSFVHKTRKKPYNSMVTRLLSCAGAEGFEPSTKVLETHVLPLHHAPIGNGMIIRKQGAFVKQKIDYAPPWIRFSFTTLYSSKNILQLFTVRQSFSKLFTVVSIPLLFINLNLRITFRVFECSSVLLLRFKLRPGKWTPSPFISLRLVFSV